MGKPEEEKVYKRTFKPAEWVSEEAASSALHTYERLHEKITEAIREGYSPECAEVKYNAIEQLLTNIVFKSLWEVDDSLERYFFNIFELFSEHPPMITNAQKIEKIKQCIQHLKSIINLTKFDNSVLTHFNAALESSITSQFLTKIDWWKAGFKRYDKENTRQFLERLCENLEEDMSVGTHYHYPRKLTDAERIYFILSVSNIVLHIKGSIDHQLTANILNVIRSDLGNFDSNGISKAVNRRKKERLTENST